MPEYFIQGEAGKALDDAMRAVSAFGEDAEVTFTNAEADKLTFTIYPKDLSAANPLIPEPGQTVSLFDGVTRIFTGVVDALETGDMPESSMVKVSVPGPWWWLENTALSESVMGADAVSKDRVQFSAPKGDARQHMINLINRAITVGVPIALGTIDTCYDIPTQTIADTSFAQALAKLMEWVPDGVAKWTYSDAGNPRFNFTRRNPGAAVALAKGAAPYIGAELSPAFGLKVEEAVISYAERAEDGGINYKEQSSGAGGLGTRQVLVTSGPELADFLPPDPLDSYSVTTVEARVPNPAAADWMTQVEKLWKVPLEAEDRHDPGVGVPPTLRAWHPDDLVSPGSDRYDDGARPYYYYENGDQLDNASIPRRAILEGSDRRPSWLADVIPIEKGKLVGTFFYAFNRDSSDTAANLAYFDELISRQDYSSRQILGDGTIDYWIFYNLEVDVEFTPLPYNNVEMFQPPAWIFEDPPAGLAANLQSAQGWLPYVGDIELHDEAAFTRRLGDTMNITGTQPAWATMGTLVQSERIQLATRLQTLRVGAPNRLAGTNIVTKLPRNPRDNIVIL